MALLLDFHTATDQASNALLKTLEEPPPNVILILTAESKETLLPTIVSRCEVIALRTVATDDIAAFLVSQGESQERSFLLAGIASGRPGWAISVLKNPTILEKREQLLDELTKLIAENRQNRFAYVRDWNDSLRKQFPVLDDRRKECISVLELWLGYWRDVMLVALGNMEPKGNPDRKDDIDIHSRGIPKTRIMQILGSLQDTIVAVDKNANIQLALEALMIDLPRYESGRSS
jgi:DNA polymerase-3 subunit delta'